MQRAPTSAGGINIAEVLKESAQMKLVSELLSRVESFYFEIFDEVSDQRKQLATDAHASFCVRADHYLND